VYQIGQFSGMAADYCRETSVDLTGVYSFCTEVQQESLSDEVGDADAFILCLSEKPSFPAFVEPDTYTGISFCQIYHLSDMGL